MALREQETSRENNQADISGEESLERYVRKIASFGGLPAIANQIQEVMAIASDERSSSSRFANVILKNVSLTAKLLHIVNTVYFCQRTPVYTISHAIKLLGWDIVRDTAASLMFLTDIGTASETVGELLQLSVLTAHNAMGLAVLTGYPRPEEAYLCGMFSVFGELLVARYMPEQFDKILELKKSSNEEQGAVSQKIMGFTFNQLGKAMLKHWGMPEKLAAGTRHLESISRQPQTEEQKLSFLATFSRELTNHAYRSGLGKDDRTWLKSFLSAYGASLQATEADVEEILAQSHARTEKAFLSSGISLDKIRYELSLEEKAAAAHEGIDKKALRRFAEEVSAVLHSQEALEINDIVVMIMEAIYRGVGFDRILFCLSDKDRTHLRARLALGQGAEELKGEFNFPISFLEGPVGPAMMRGKDVYVESIGKSRYGRSNFVKIVGAQSFMMLPVKVNHQMIGCLYADRVTEPLVLDEEDKEVIEIMRNDLCHEMATRNQ